MTAIEHPAAAPDQHLSEDGYERALKPRQIQMIAIGGAIGTGLFLGAGSRLQIAGPALALVYFGCGVFGGSVPRWRPGPVFTVPLGMQRRLNLPSGPRHGSAVGVGVGRGVSAATPRARATMVSMSSLPALRPT